MGRSAGQRLWQLAKQDKGLGNQEYFDRLREMRAMLKAIQITITFHIMDNAFEMIDNALEIAARGADDVAKRKSAESGNQ